MSLAPKSLLWFNSFREIEQRAAMPYGSHRVTYVYVSGSNETYGKSRSLARQSELERFARKVREDLSVN